MTDAVDNPPPSRWTAVGLFLLFFLPFLPAISWTEFSGGMENFNVGTAQEIARNGNWLIPTLNGETRTKKPPLASWISAAGIRLTESLPWGARLPNVLCTGLLVVAIRCFGREIGGARLGLIAALVGGSSFLVLQFAIPAQYDMPLAVCITLTNLYLAKLALRGRWLEGSIGAGFWLGLACMIKGPVALLMTLVPFVAFAFIRRPEEVPHQPIASVAVRNRLLAILAGAGVFLAVAAPWPIYISCSLDGQMGEWFGQLTQRQERLNEEHSWWWKYVLVVPWFAPWSLWYVVGILAWCIEKTRPQRRRMLLVLLMVWLPVFVLSFYPARRPRYILPLVSPLAVLAAWRIEQHFARPETWKTADRLLVIGHGGIIATLAVGLPVAGMFFLRTVEGVPWYGFAPGFASLAIMLVMLSLMWRRMADWRFHVGGSAVLMLAVTLLFLWGYKDTPGGRSPARGLAARISQQYPEAEFFSLNKQGQDSPTELTIYLNREVRRCADPSVIPGSTRPQIVFMGTQEAGETPDRPGWRLVDRQFIGKTWWYALIRTNRE